MSFLSCCGWDATPPREPGAATTRRASPAAEDDCAAVATGGTLASVPPRPPRRRSAADRERLVNDVRDRLGAAWLDDAGAVPATRYTVRSVVRFTPKKPGERTSQSLNVSISRCVLFDAHDGHITERVVRQTLGRSAPIACSGAGRADGGFRFRDLSAARPNDRTIGWSAHDDESSSRDRSSRLVAEQTAEGGRARCQAHW